MRRIPVLLGAAALVTAALAGCTALPGSGGCTPLLESGDASEIVTSDGSGADFPTPLVAGSPQVSVIERGDGPVVQDGAQVFISSATYYGPDGQDLTGEASSRFVQAGMEPGADDLPTAINDALVCAHVGDRIALASPLVDAYGAGALGSEEFDQDTVVVVIDIEEAYLGKADGFNQLPADGMPTVVTAVDGTPGVSVLLQEPPTATRSSVIKGGSGQRVDEGDTIVAHASIFTWPASAGEQPEPVQSTWDSHAAQTYSMSDDVQGLAVDVVDAIVGEKVGSQILVVVPPGEGASDGDPTYIFVVDVLGIQDAAD